jgi:hypothetical protein
MGSVGIKNIDTASKAVNGGGNNHKSSQQCFLENEYTIPDVPMGTRRNIKVIFIGMGISGINFAREVQQNSQGIELAIYDKNVGALRHNPEVTNQDLPLQAELDGTWYENR